MRVARTAASLQKRLSQLFLVHVGWVTGGSVYPAGLDRFDRQLLLKEAELLVDAEQPLEIGGRECLAYPGGV